MNTNLTEIAFILDRSGSMSGITNETIAGFNQFLADQQALPGEARLTLILFDDHYELLTQALPVKEVRPLDCKTYTTRGCTALLDAIGRTIDDIGGRLANTPEMERPGKVIIAILTDGQENASTQFNNAAINQRIRHQQETYAWEFLFLGANQDAIATAAKMGIGEQNVATWTADAAGSSASLGSMSRKAGAMRKFSMGFSDEETTRDLAMPVAAILKEEDAKARQEPGS